MGRSINVFSMCDGMSCGQIALRELGYDINRYYASEIDKNSIKVTMHNFPDTVQIGDVNNIDAELLGGLPKIDLVIFGSPCRSLSKATLGREEYSNGLEGVSGLFYVCADILRWLVENNNPDLMFLCENVDSSRKADIGRMSEVLGVDPLEINSGLFSAQDRRRLYWTNIPVPELPTSCGLVMDDILESSVGEKYYYKQPHEVTDLDKRVCATLGINGHDILKRVYNTRYKSPTLTACRGGNRQVKIYEDGRVRRLTPEEYRRLQTIPDWYKTDCVAESHVYNMCGDGWTVEVIKHIFKGIGGAPKGRKVKVGYAELW